MTERRPSAWDAVLDLIRELRDRFDADLEDARTVLADLRERVADLERTCENDPPGGQGGSTFDPPGPSEGPVRVAETPENFQKKICGEE